MRHRSLIKLDRCQLSASSGACPRQASGASGRWLSALLLLASLAGAGCSALGDSTPKSAATAGNAGAGPSQFVSHRLPIPNAPLLAEFLLNDQGERLLLMHETRWDKVRPFILARVKPGAVGANPAPGPTVTCERVWSHPKGAAFYAFKIDGEVVGFLTVQANASYTFDRSQA